LVPHRHVAKRCGPIAAVVLGLIVLAVLQVGSSGAKSSLCRRYAAPSGSDSNSGSLSAPYQSAQRLADSLSPGQTGCLRAGTYDPKTIYVLNLDNGGTGAAPITIRSYPGERAILIGIIQLQNGANHVTIESLNIQGDGSQNTIQIYAADDTIQDSNITNNWRGLSCLMLGSNNGPGPATRPLIRHNRFHDCGNPANGSFDHAIYAADVDHGQITDNIFWNSAGYAIQLYPNAQTTLFAHNIVDGDAPSGRGGVILGGDLDYASSNDTVSHNIVAYSRTPNISGWWAGRTGTGNQVRNNCLYGGGGGNIAGTGFIRSNNTAANPRFVDKKAHDYQLQPGSLCRKALGSLHVG
jgi:hypothetical protein